MPWDLKQSFGTTTFIPVPEIPDHFFPGTKPIKALARGGGGGKAAPAEAIPSSKEKPGSPKQKGSNSQKGSGVLGMMLGNSTLWNITETEDLS
jgi:hypothetical protein